ncbi:MAG: hypothetical protein EBT07_16180 [Actinobacteria bacterium]|nr:hypothetical protein [Actinomycetota bacterium]
MATTSKILFRGAASTSSTTLYTTPSATTTVVTDIVVTNTAAASGTYELLLNDVVLAKTVTVGANDSTIIQLKQPLTAAQTIKGLASATTFLVLP